MSSHDVEGRLEPGSSSEITSACAATQSDQAAAVVDVDVIWRQWADDDCSSQNQQHLSRLLAKCPSPSCDTPTLTAFLREQCLTLSAQSLKLKSYVQSLVVVKRSDLVRAAPQILGVIEAVNRAIERVRTARECACNLRREQLQKVQRVIRLAAHRRELQRTLDEADVFNSLLVEGKELKQLVHQCKYVQAAQILRKICNFVNANPCRSSAPVLQESVNALSSQLYLALRARTEQLLQHGAPALEIELPRLGNAYAALGDSRFAIDVLEVTLHLSWKLLGLSATTEDETLREMDNGSSPDTGAFLLAKQVPAEQTTSFLGEVYRREWGLCSLFAQWHRWIVLQSRQPGVDAVFYQRSEKAFSDSRLVLWTSISKLVGQTISALTMDTKTLSAPLDFLCICAKTLRFCLEGFCFVEKLDLPEHNTKWYTRGLPNPWDVTHCIEIFDALKLHIKAYLLSLQTTCLSDLKVAILQDSWARLPVAQSCIEDYIDVTFIDRSFVSVSVLYTAPSPRHRVTGQKYSFAPAVRKQVNPFASDGTVRLLLEALVKPSMKSRTKELSSPGTLVLTSTSKLLIRRIQGMIHVACMAPFLFPDLFALALHLADFFTYCVSLSVLPVKKLAMLTSESRITYEDAFAAYDRRRNVALHATLAALMQHFHKLLQYGTVGNDSKKGKDDPVYPTLLRQNGHLDQGSLDAIASIINIADTLHAVHLQGFSIAPLAVLTSPGQSYGLTQRCVAIEAAQSVYQMLSWVFLRKGKLEEVDDTANAAPHYPPSIQAKFAAIISALLVQRRRVLYELRSSVLHELCAALIDLAPLTNWFHTRLGRPDATADEALPADLLKNFSVQLNDIERRVRFAEGGSIPLTTRKALWVIAGVHLVQEAVTAFAAVDTPFTPTAPLNTAAWWTNWRKVFLLVSQKIACASRDVNEGTSSSDAAAMPVVSTVEPWIDPTNFEKYLDAHRQLSSSAHLMEWLSNQDEFSSYEILRLARKCYLHESLPASGLQKKRIREELQSAL